MAQGEIDGEPILVRSNQALKPFIGKTDFVVKVGIAMAVNTKNTETGLPGPEENEQLSIIEDLALEILPKYADGFQALAITTGDMKEFIFYVKETADIEGFHKEMMSKVNTHEVTCKGCIEKKWETFKEWGC